MCSSDLAPMRLAELQQLAPQLHELLARHGASNPAVFGSVARDQASASSDVDLLIDLPAGASLFDRAELMSSDIRFWSSGDTKTGPPDGLLMGA